MVQLLLVVLALSASTQAYVMRTGPPLRRGVEARPRTLCMQVADGDAPPPAVSESQQPASSPNYVIDEETGKPDLSKMTFDERLEYLAQQIPDSIPEETDDTTMFGIDTSNAETLWWSPKFLSLCLQDLQDMQWPTRKQTIQTVVTSQIAFVVVFVVVLLFDAFADQIMRSLIQGTPFSITMDTILKVAQKPQP